jgi:hypothetical protein
MEKATEGVVGYDVVDPFEVKDANGVMQTRLKHLSRRFASKEAAETFRDLALPNYPRCYVRPVLQKQRLKIF